MTRQQKTEKQRAEEAHAVAIRKVKRLVQAEAHQAGLLEITRRELDEARRLLEYRAAHPALQSTTPTTTEETTRP